ncbi:MAG: response regulator [bacterium]
MNAHGIADILLVEDNPGDVDLTREGLRRGKVASNLAVLDSGSDVLPYLERRGRFVGAPTPDLILLDLNLPGKDGREVLAELKNHPEYKRIPVVVMTSSEAEEDIVRAYTSHANCYITKPVDLKQFLKVVSSIEDFWLTLVRLPASEADLASH